MSYVALLGYNLRRATAHTKALNFTSNLAALLGFLAGGHVAWTIAAMMADGQLIEYRARFTSRTSPWLDPGTLPALRSSG